MLVNIIIITENLFGAQFGELNKCISISKRDLSITLFFVIFYIIFC